jgi:integrase/recombinase XerD
MPDLLRRTLYRDHRDLRRDLRPPQARCTHLLRQGRKGGPDVTIEPVTELGSGSALRVPRARVVPLSAPPSSYTAAVERYLIGAGIAKSSARIYRISLTTWGWMLAGEPAPTGPARRGAKPPVFPVTAIDDPALPEVLAELAAARADQMDADTVNRELSIARKAIGWWQRQGWINGDPTIGIERRPAPPDRTKALAENQIAALWRLDVALREKTFWKMLYESAARADEVLCLNVEDLYPQDKRGKITAKGGATEWIHWQSGTAQLLPRLIAGRTRGPLFLTGRKAPAGTATLDVCEETGQARLSYRRAEEIFEESTRLLANPLAREEDIEELEGLTLHRLRHSALTHDAERGTSTPMLLARSRHASVRSLERYARPSIDAVAAHVAASDPAARRRG